MPTTEIGAPINRALLPGFAKMADSSTVLSAYQNAVGMLAIIAIPAAAGLFAVTPFFVPVILGNKWLGGVPLMEVLTISGTLMMFQLSICSILIAKGYPQIVTRVNALFVVTLLGFMVLFASLFGALGAAYAALATTTVTTPCYLYQLQLRVGVPFSLFFHTVTRPVAASIAMILVVRHAFPAYSTAMPASQAASWLVGEVALGATTYIISVLVLWALAGRPLGVERLMLDEVFDRLKRLPKRQGEAD